MKKRYVFILAGAMVLSFGLCACAGSNSDTVVMGTMLETEVEKSVTDAGEETVTEVVESEEVVLDIEETIVETEMFTYETSLEWAKKIKTELPQLSIWNTETKQGILLENGQEYNIKQGDNLVLCGNFEGSVHTDIEGIKLNKVISTSIHQEYEFVDISMAVYSLNIHIKVNEEEYELGLLLRGEDTVDSASASTLEDTLSGKEWAATLEYDEPKLIVWNDETGTKEVIDNGGEYQMQEGDVLGLYHGADYRPFTTEPYEFCEGFVMGMNFTIMEGCNLPEESQTIDLGIEFSDVETGDFFTYYFIITTP